MDKGLLFSILVLGSLIVSAITVSAATCTFRYGNTAFANNAIINGSSLILNLIYIGNGSSENLTKVSWNFTAATANEIDALTAANFSAVNKNDSNYNVTIATNTSSDRKYTLNITAVNQTAGMKNVMCSQKYTGIVVNNTRWSGTLQGPADNTKITSTTDWKRTFSTLNTSDSLGSGEEINSATLVLKTTGGGINRYTATLSGTNNTNASYATTAGIPNGIYDWYFDVIETDGSTITTGTRRLEVDVQQGGVSDEVVRRALEQQQGIQPPNNNKIILVIIITVLIGGYFVLRKGG